MDKQKQVDGAVGSDGGGSQSVGQEAASSEAPLTFDRCVRELIEAHRVSLEAEGTKFSKDADFHLNYWTAHVCVFAEDYFEDQKKLEPEWEAVSIDEGRVAFVDWITSIGCNDGPPEWDEDQEEFKEQEVQFAFRAYMAGCEYANPAPAASPAQAPALSNTEGTADQSDSTTTNTQTTLPPIITKSPFKEPPVPQTVNVEEER